MGSATIDTPGGQVTWDDVSSEPIVMFSRAAGNQTYLSMALELSLNMTSSDPLTVLSSSTVYLSWLQTGMQAASSQSPIMASEVNPVVPFKLDGQDSNQPKVLMTLLYLQPHPLIVTDSFMQAFDSMRTDSSKRQNFDFQAFCNSSSITNLQAATWMVVNGTSAEGGGSIGGGETVTQTVQVTMNPSNTGDSGQQVTSMVTMDASGSPTVFTTAMVSSDCGCADESQETVPMMSTTDAAGSSTTMVTTTPGMLPPPAASDSTSATASSSSSSSSLSSSDNGTPTTVEDMTTTDMLMSTVTSAPTNTMGGSSEYCNGQGGSVVTVMSTVTVTVADMTHRGTIQLRDTIRHWNAIQHWDTIRHCDQHWRPDWQHVDYVNFQFYWDCAD
ncbi:83b50a51-af45-4b37-b9da-5dcb92ab02c8 [Thermothielavioides terrestris]|uniref:83b50a51-af45-4b37-b9da-5dcb92ab02c8 n=1 Tax=Thermothielavioides terrestris TaxID=2587410 RepID=A0A3S4BB77_9PEZI|nr:83b50a51-af45-4b37-b9da-5dcb92ab02c8 [Thermothielavioides terrestris]